MFIWLCMAGIILFLMISYTFIVDIIELYHERDMTLIVAVLTYMAIVFIFIFAVFYI